MLRFFKTLFFLSLLRELSATKYTERQCVTACENTLRFGHLWLRRQCNACVKDPPIGAYLCSAAISQPDNEYFQKIAAVCVTLTDKDCIMACKDQTKPKFNEICAKCVRSPPITADMCIFACNKSVHNEINMYSVCLQCAVNPPPSAKLCRYACQRTANNFYRGMCSSSVCRAVIQQ